jgi:hypothetical protein
MGGCRDSLQDLSVCQDTPAHASTFGWPQPDMPDRDTPQNDSIGSIKPRRQGAQGAPAAVIIPSLHQLGNQNCPKLAKLSKGHSMMTSDWIAAVSSEDPR